MRDRKAPPPPDDVSSVQMDARSLEREESIYDAIDRDPAPEWDVSHTYDRFSESMRFSFDENTGMGHYDEIAVTRIRNTFGEARKVVGRPNCEGLTGVCRVDCGV